MTAHRHAPVISAEKIEELVGMMQTLDDTMRDGFIKLYDKQETFTLKELCDITNLSVSATTRMIGMLQHLPLAEGTRKILIKDKDATGPTKRVSILLASAQ